MNPITRRQLLRRAAAGGAVLALPGLLAACGGEEAEPAAPAPAPGGEPPAPAAGAGKLVWANWQLYIDTGETETEHPTIDAFTAATGIEVEYLDGDVNGNEEFFAKLQQLLEAGQDVGRDLCVLTDTSGVPGRMIELGYAEKLDKSVIPNAVNLLDVHRSPSYDPSREYTLPWVGGMTGIGYDPEKVGGDVTSLEQLFTDPKLKGKVTFLTDMGDTIGLAHLLNGDDPTTITQESFDRAIAAVQSAFDSGQVRQFTGNEYSSMLAQGDVWAAMAWSGDIYQLLPTSPNLKWVQPAEGGMIWTDQLLIPKGGNVTAASMLINHYYDPKVAATLVEGIAFISPVEGAKEELLATNPDFANNPLMFPPDDVLAKAKLFDVAAANDDAFKEAFQAVLGA
jgi:spermidine/putrescine transport system substrate-binding protein